MCNSLIYACVTKLTFPFTLYHMLKASGLLVSAYFIHSVREDIYIYINDGSTSLYICKYAVCVCVCCFRFTSYVIFFSSSFI